ncbi:polyhydroxybutyrate depolymerase [Alteromonas sp. 345S023]|uniref:Polyhydroxybutyrate depolymerase n=1 Tax=Alteromonas profundi TaxID=2696062 RepID=A0A7X5LKE8_9ALTE|nr:PHB depolymerase family esterase [Alteromonas profundi]NDV90995.1 polyhydroxybutyrate depolymerase [Alteromonas profundi]
MKLTTLIASAVASALCLSPLAQGQENQKVVPKLSLDLNEVTVSGLSSGGYMATQFHLAHSDWVRGVGVLAGGPYYCAQGDITTALAQCVNKVDGEIDVNGLSAQAATYASEGKLADMSNLKDAKVWLFHGTRDNRVIREVSDLLFEQYKSWTDTQNIKYVNDKPIAHVFPTQHNGTECTSSQSPYIGNCGYDAAGDMLTHLVSDLTPPDDTLSGQLYVLNQTAIAGSNAKTLASEGFVYVPKSCAEGERCRAHISFHGCNQYADAVGDAYTTQTGLNAWADDNNMVVLYPQTKKSLFMPLNPQGCWDWWGYSSPDYANREGDQIKAVEALLSSLNTASTQNTEETTGE